MTSQIFLILAGLYLAWSLGANNSTNLMSMAVGSRVVSYRKALVFTVICLMVGTLFLSKNVIKTVSSGIVDVDLITVWQAAIALFVAAAWVHFATWRKWPVSISHSIVSGALGLGIAESMIEQSNLIHWDTLYKLALIWLFSPIFGFFAGLILFKVVHGFVPHRHLYFKDTFSDWIQHPMRSLRSFFTGYIEKREVGFKALLFFSAGYMAVAMGANTVAATTGLIYSGFEGKGTLFGFHLSDVSGLLILKMLVLFGVLIGIVTYGNSLTDFLANRLMKLNPIRGAVIQFTAASVILFSALLGYPLSTTGVFIGAFLGVDSGQDHPQMKRKAARDLRYAFLVTIPVVASVTALIDYFVFGVLN